MGKSGNKPQSTKSTTKKAVQAKHSPPKKGGGKSGLTSKESDIIQALANLHAVGKTQPARSMVEAMSGNSKTKEGFKKNMGILRKKGCLEFPDSNTVAITEKGLSLADTPDPESMTNETFQEQLIKILISKKAGQIFDAISSGKVHQKNQVAKELGYDMSKLSGYEKDLSKMKTLGFLHKTDTTIQLTDECFPFGRSE